MLLFSALARRIDWVVPDGYLAEDARAGGVGGALDEALREGDAAPLNAYLRRAPDARVCFEDEWNSLRFSPLLSYWRTYGLPNLVVPDGHWALMVLHVDRLPEFAVVPTQRLLLTRGDPPSRAAITCIGAARLRFELEKEDRPGWPSTLRTFVER